MLRDAHAFTSRRKKKIEWTRAGVQESSALLELCSLRAEAPKLHTVDMPQGCKHVASMTGLILGEPRLLLHLFGVRRLRALLLLHLLHQPRLLRLAEVER